MVPWPGVKPEGVMGINIQRILSTNSIHLDLCSHFRESFTAEELLKMHLTSEYVTQADSYSVNKWQVFV